METHDTSLALLWNGTEFVPCDGIPISDRGFRYGMALFESLAVRNGAVEFLQGHLERLGAACFQCDWPLDFSALSQAGERLRAISGSAFARIYITAGEGGPSDPVTDSRFFLFVEPRTAAPATGQNSTFIRHARTHPVPHLPLLGGLKTSNYWANLEALRQARDADCEEALLFNPQGELISACMANVFVVINGELFTPASKTGARLGVIRHWVMKQRKTITEMPLTQRELSLASECFLTSSWHGIRPVASLDSRPLSITVAKALRAELLCASKE